MAELTFSQAERRNFAAPIVVALLILAAGVGFFLWHMPYRATQLTVTHVSVLPTHTVFSSDSKVVGAPEQTEDAFFVVATLRIENHLKVPLFINDMTGTLVTAEGASVDTSAVEQNNFQNLFTTFPKLKPLAGTPLQRETSIAPGDHAEGTVILSFPVSQDDWNKRNSAAINVNFYHQGSFSVPIPKQ